jgi:hypothetical protein
MARAGRRFPLVIYRETINRWWPETFVLSLFLLFVTWLAYRDPLGQVQPWRWKGVLYMGGVTFLFSIMLLVMRSAAYVQTFPTYLKLVTPFLRLNISYKRLRRYTTAEMRTLFPPDKMRGWKRDLIAPLGGRTAVVLELNGWPIQPKLLRVFLFRVSLSPFFFKDKTPHFVILVNDWMRFSMELESMRSRKAEGSGRNQPRPRNPSILSRLPQKDS